MNRAAKIPMLSRRKRRREKDSSPVLRIWATVLSTLLVLLLLIILVPSLSAAVGVLYLAEGTPPWVDRIVEGLAVEAVSFYADNLYEGELPPPDAVAITTAREFKTTKIFDRTGKHLLWEVYAPHGGNRQPVGLERISPHLRNATIALEDKTFYDNPGVNLRGIARAAYLLISSGEIQGGGSSITQQLVKLVALDAEERWEQKYERKIKEAMLAVELSRRYDKDTILEWYLNTINYGRRAYGAQAAAAEYFGKDVANLTIAEAAMLAMLPNAPALYDPYTNAEEALERQEIVLQRMKEEGYITPEEYEEALAEPILNNLVPIGVQVSDFKAPHFTIYVVQQLEEQYGTDLLYRGGLSVYTTLDYELLLKQEELARQQLASLQAEGIDASNAAIITINPRTGEILSMMGSLDYNNPEIDGQVNMALAPRQPGSSVKPYTYLTAFENGYTPASMIWDVRTVFDDYPNPPYVPENYERDYSGPVLFRDALALSLNIPAVKVMDLVGIDKVIDRMHSLGINTLHKEDVGLAMTLGGGDVRLLDHVYAFGVLANNGVMVGDPVPENERQAGYRELNPASILRIEDPRGEIIYSYTEPKTKRIISPQLSYLMQNLMSDNEARIPAFGEDNKLVLPDRPVAAKTGSTNDFRDGWTLGFTPQYVTGVWVGNADYRVMGEDAPGGKVAAPLWQQVMMHLHENEPVEEFPVPSNLVQVQICKKSGMLPTPNCPEVKTEIFIEGTQPTTADSLFQTFRICGDTGLATVHCPSNLIRNEVFMMIPPEAEDWARSSDIPRPPTAYDSSHGPVAGGDVSITNPAPYSYVRGNVSLDGNAFVPLREQRRVVTTDQGSSFEITESVSTFRLYRVQVGEGLDPPEWIQIGPDHLNYGRKIHLESWNTYNFADGLYTVQLTAVEWNDNVQRSAIQVTIDNSPPTVELTYPYPNQLYELGGDSWLNFQADASDNIAIDKVEFYVNGNFFDSSSSSFNVRWALEDANLAEGEEQQAEIWAVAVDAAGNRTESQRIRIRVKKRE
jgi:penicillin-binding protein 1C